MLATALVGCGSADSLCPGGAVQRPVGPALSAEESAVSVATWELDETTGLRTISTNQFRFEGDTAIIGEERVSARIADDVIVVGCATEEGPDGIEDLLAARFGATFYVDPDAAELVRATCNGCD
mgnify:FL=1